MCDEYRNSFLYICADSFNQQFVIILAFLLLYSHKLYNVCKYGTFIKRMFTQLVLIGTPCLFELLH